LLFSRLTYLPASIELPSRSPRLYGYRPLGAVAIKADVCAQNNWTMVLAILSYWPGDEPLFHFRPIPKDNGHFSAGRRILCLSERNQDEKERRNAIRKSRKGKLR
jgi:hypothetical protein